LIGFRTNKAYARFWSGTTLLHQMWGEWFDAVSCLVAFSSTAKKSKPVEVADFRHTLVRLMSLCHASALEEISLCADAPEGYPCIDIGGLDQRTLRWLKECKFNKELNFNRVEVIIHMIQNLIIEKNEAGVLKVPPPILSRVFQTISRGQVNLANCKKITYTLFPMPYAQLISALLLVWSLNYVAAELELPFGDDHNDLPLEEFQGHMNASMLMLIRDESDIVPSVSGRCHRDYDLMKGNISTRRPRDFIEEGGVDEVPETKSLKKEEPKVNEAAKEKEFIVVGKAADPAPVAPPAAAPPAPAPAAPTPVPTPAPAPVLPPAPSAEELRKVAELQKHAELQRERVASLEQALHTRMDDLCGQLEDLMGNVVRLSTNVGQSTGGFQEFIKHTSRLTTQLGQTQLQLGQATGAMMELSRETNVACKTLTLKTTKDLLSVPRSPAASPGRSGDMASQGHTPQGSCPNPPQSGCPHPARAWLGGPQQLFVDVQPS